MNQVALALLEQAKIVWLWTLAREFCQKVPRPKHLGRKKFSDITTKLNGLGLTETESQWKDDMEMLVQTLGDLYENITPGILCGLVDQALA